MCVCLCVCVCVCVYDDCSCVQICRYRSGCVALAQNGKLLKIIVRLPFGKVQERELLVPSHQRRSCFGELEQALAGALSKP
jgi:hypothetical protein